MQPWAQIRILDISQGIAGPYCAQIMASQGAQVFKVESPAGDWGRFIGVTCADHSGMSLQYNQGKRGVAIDGKHPEGQALLQEMIRSCDVVIQNFRPGVAKRLGIEYETLKATQPDLIYVSISGYGPDGPAADMPATDSVMQADAGVMHMNRAPDGTPHKIGMPIVDAITGMYASQALSAALFHRLSTGEGAHVEVSLFESCLALQGFCLIENAIAGPQPVQAVSAPNGVFSTQDGRLMIVSLTDEQFARVCRALDAEEWLQDARFINNEARMRNRQAIDALINQKLSTDKTEAWIERMKHHEVLHARLRDYENLMHHPQVDHLNLFQTQSIPNVGSIPTMSSPLAMFRRNQTPAPVIGENTVEALLEFGLDQTRIDNLLEAGVIKQAGTIQ